ncbi:DExH-box ATP-dependent RNA helicase DExH17 [Seminavis robusta]|uniref:DNA 3'-5' helicase n=1 Tax=Seminavis robusta TaxID=568900 RepID=A0A9N8DJ14_9STRA|nr:DExH-box ATP-dependent RNA helicase DExH17 [Seminavis robusta]|eukprot:Sro155_g070300.1 DExH-box ATP-dependent RNA helicase DExH17 (1990) ;mRNA; r:8945-15172
MAKQPNDDDDDSSISSSSSSSSDDDSTEEQLQRMEEKLRRGGQKDEESNAPSDLDSIGSEAYKAIDDLIERHSKDPTSLVNEQDSVKNKMPVVEVKVENSSIGDSDDTSLAESEDHERRSSTSTAKKSASLFSRNGHGDSVESPSPSPPQPKAPHYLGGRQIGTSATAPRDSTSTSSASSSDSSASPFLGSTPTGTGRSTGNQTYPKHGTIGLAKGDKSATAARPTTIKTRVNPYKKTTSTPKAAGTASVRTPPNASNAATATPDSEILLTPYTPSPRASPSTKRRLQATEKESSASKKPTNGAETTAQNVIDLVDATEDDADNLTTGSKAQANDGDFPMMFDVNGSDDDDTDDDDVQPVAAKTNHGAAKKADSRFFRKGDAGSNTGIGGSSSNTKSNKDVDKTTRKDDSPERSGFDDGNGILDFASMNDAKIREIDPSLYVPTTHESSPDPIVHSFNVHNRPMNTRKRTPVEQVFPPHIAKFWKCKFHAFNHLQSEVVNVLANSNDQVLVSSPTGSGKSTIFEIAMARLIYIDLLNQPKVAHRPSFLSRHRKMVYVAPSKALCEERYNDWNTRLSALGIGISVAMITGDDKEPGDSYRNLAESQLIVTTPEKFDSMTRRWTENFYLFATIKLFMVDEVHMVGDPSRGWCLEAIVCRMKTIQRAARNVAVTHEELLMSSYPHTTPEAIASSFRFVAVSATLPNIQDCASLLSASECYTFDASYRPVPLTMHIVNLGTIGKNEFQFWNTVHHRVPGLIQKYSNKKPTIVFCHSKKDTEKLASFLAQAKGVGFSHGTVKAKVASQTRNTQLQRCLLEGVAFHHAGLEAGDRKVVEKGFAEGDIRVLCATSTLAQGVNLPVHLVIIKGTTAWRGSGCGYQDIDAASILQMVGRAGRPGFDTSGTAVIMTDNKSKARIERLSGGLGPAESQLERKLIEVINAEISQQVICSPSTALNWLRGTLYYARARKNPSLFGLHDTSIQSFDAFLLEKCEEKLRKLHLLRFICWNQQQNITPLPACHIMASGLVGFEASEIMAGIPFDSSLRQILLSICGIEDLQRPLRRNEKAKLNEAHKNIRFKLEGQPSKVRVQTAEQKAFVMLQAHIGQHRFDDYSLFQETEAMVQYSSRMLSALEEYSAKGSRNGHVAAQSLKLRRSLFWSLWRESDGALKQIKNAPMVALRMHGIVTFDDVEKSTASELEKASNRPPPFGSTLRAEVARAMQQRLKVSARVVYGADGESAGHIECKLEGQPGSATASEHTSSEDCALTYTLIAYTDRPGGCLIFLENVFKPDVLLLRCPSSFGLVVIQLIASMVGFDEKVEVRGNNSINPCSYTTHKSKGIAPVFDRQPKAKRQSTIRNLMSSTGNKSQQSKSKPSASSRKDPSIDLGTDAKRRRLMDNADHSYSTQRTSSHLAIGPQRQPSPQAEETPQLVNPNPARANMSGQTIETANVNGWAHQPMQPKARSDSHPGAPPNESPTISPPMDQTSQIFSRHPGAPPGATTRISPPMGQTSQHFSRQARTPNVSSMPASAASMHRPGMNATAQRRSVQDRPSRRLTQSPFPNGPSMTAHPPNGPSQATPLYPQANTRSPASQTRRGGTQARRVSQASSAGIRPSQSPHASQSISSRQSNSWRKEKRQQVNSQERAFTKKNLNPFKIFSHDPNDAEGFLDNLNNNNENRENSLIPQQEREVMRRESALQRPNGLIPQRFTSEPRRRRQGRKFQENISEQELLARKNEETNAFFSDTARRSMPSRRVSPIPPPRLHQQNLMAPPSRTPGNLSVVTTDHDQQHQPAWSGPQEVVAGRQHGHANANSWQQQQDQFLSYDGFGGVGIGGDPFDGDGPWDETAQWDPNETNENWETFGGQSAQVAQPGMGPFNRYQPMVQDSQYGPGPNSRQPNPLRHQHQFQSQLQPQHSQGTANSFNNPGFFSGPALGGASRPLENRGFMPPAATMHGQQPLRDHSMQQQQTQQPGYIGGPEGGAANDDGFEDAFF